MIQGIISLFNTLPALVALLSRLGDVLGRFQKWADQNKLNAWIDQLEKNIDQLEGAKTPEDKLNAAKGLADSIRNLG